MEINKSFVNQYKKEAEEALKNVEENGLSDNAFIPVKKFLFKVMQKRILLLAEEILKD